MEERIVIYLDEDMKKKLKDLLNRGYTSEQIFKIGLIYLERGGDDVLLKIYNKLYDIDNKSLLILILITSLLRLFEEKAMLIKDTAYTLMGTYPMLLNDEYLNTIIEESSKIIRLVNNTVAMVGEAIKATNREELREVINEIVKMMK